jgi:hypothetical protein
VCDAFVDELWWEEQDSTKHNKICELKLTGEEWVQVITFLGLLTVCVLFFSLTHQVLTLLSMLMPHNMHFHLKTPQHFILQFLH